MSRRITSIDFSPAFFVTVIVIRKTKNKFLESVVVTAVAKLPKLEC